MSDWVKPPLERWQGEIWVALFPGSSFYAHYESATRPNHPNTISIKRMEKFTQACVVARLKGKLK